MTDLRAECLAMAEEFLTYSPNSGDRNKRLVVLLRRVADALPQEPQGDVVEAVAKAIRDEVSRGIGLARLFSEDSARAALSAAEPFIQARIAAAVEPGGWQPIETAPKDGTWLLGWANDNAPYRISWGRNHNDRLAWCTTFGSFVEGYITHWRPLPAPPAIRQPDPAGQQEEVR